MIIVRSPLRISFVGGGTDLPGFYREHGGAVLSATIDKYVYIALSGKVFSGEIILKYSETERSLVLDSIVHTRFREALRMFEVERSVEIASFADISAQTGLGSSSSFSVALVRALSTLRGKALHQLDAARLACDLEIDILKEPIGRQDQYASACGGFNIIRFNKDDSVSVEPVYLDFTTRAKLEDHCMLFYTGITRSASSVLSKQSQDISAKVATYKKMAASVDEFRERLLEGDIVGLGAMLHEGWMMKRSLSGAISNNVIDVLYETALSSGAYGGKLLGAGGGGCILVLADPQSQEKIRANVAAAALAEGLLGFKEIPFSFTQSGVETLYSSAEVRHA